MVSLDISISVFPNNVLESDVKQHPAQPLSKFWDIEIKV